ncbi:MAG: hypothetical protein GWP19_14650 [Planctomycetia bacterium]|nr:hypothetical protein [Planctomycetia bacterium]
MIEIVTITLSSDMNFLNLNDQGDLRFGDFVGEPMRITKKKPKVEKGIIEIEGELVNFPVVHYVRDSTPPVNVELIEVFPLADGRLFIKWTKSLETDHLGYNIYFTTTLGMWEQEQSNIGQSPIESKNPTDTGDGFVSIIVGDLNSGTKYFFKITSFDTSLNESEYSNVLSEVSRVSDIENILRLQGIIYSGLTLDVSNALLGSVPSGFTTYGDFLYDSANYEVTAIYESMLLINNDGWSSLISKGVGDSGDITFQYRVYNQDTATFGSWGSEADAIGLKSFSISGTAFQYRFIFKSPNWSNADSIIVKELI